jgi:hypothetical protein
MEGSEKEAVLGGSVHVYTDAQSSELRKALMASSRVSGQELRVTPTEEGWEITLYSAWHENSGPLVEVLIPKDPKRPAVEVKRMALG